MEEIDNIEREDLSEVPVKDRPVLRQGDRGPWVEELQRELRQVTFYNGPINGIFDAATNTAVRSFQSANRLVVDGIVGRNTWSSLIYLYAPLAICGGAGSMEVPFVGVVVDSGHGGSDSGAIGNGIVEKDMVLDISLYQDARFNELNIPHFLTRRTDEGMSSTERVNRARGAFGATPGVLLISNHVNAGGGNGAEVIYALRNRPVFSNLILNNLRDAGQQIRRVFQVPSQNNPNQDAFFILRDTANMESVIVEYGFVDNAEDAARLRANWRIYAEAVVKAVCQYAGLPYRLPYGQGNTYTVVAGDTLFSIARRFNTTVEALMSLNNLTSANIRIGQELLLPGGNVAPPPTPPVNRPILRQGDRGEAVRELQALLMQHGFSPGAIDGIFGPMTANAVRAFQRDRNLVIDAIVGPITWGALLQVSPPQETTYTVVAGDTLFALARRFNTTVEAIMNLNNLTSTTLRVGQQLRIPSGGAPRIHIVVAGDTLFSIARRFNTTVEAITRLNNLTTTVLRIGQTLQIPA